MRTQGMKYQSAHIERRLRNTYRAGWSSLDPHEDVGRVMFLEYEHTVSYDDSGYEFAHSSCVVLFTASPHFREDHGRDPSPAEVEDALHTTFGGSNCQHDYDCCGCWSSGVVDISRMDDGVWSFDISSSRNY